LRRTLSLLPMIRINQYHPLLPENATAAIYNVCRLSRYAELAYLSQFVRCYCPSLQLTSIQHYPIYILEDRQQRFGISFFGPQLLETSVSTRIATEITFLQESWLVLAPTDPGGFGRHLSSFISSVGLSSGFDSIFLFDYSQSTIQIIK
jgi:hypothetical protein